MTEQELLALWEMGRELSPLDRTVMAAQAARGRARQRGLSEGHAADWPLGERNRALAALHCELFGGVMRGYTRCRSCGEQLEFAFDARNVADAGGQAKEQRVTVGRWEFRLPTSRTLAAAAAERDGRGGARGLLGRCLVESDEMDLGHAHQALLNADWTDAEVEAIEARMAEADPLAEIGMHFDCPVCDAAFEEILDLGSFVWSELEQAARRALADVHVLARAYGWSEGEILGLSPARRQTYIEFVVS